MKTLLTYIIRKRNPKFSFDPNLSSQMTTEFVWMHVISLMRGLRLLFSLKNPRWMLLGKGVSFFNLSRIHFGKFVRIGDFVTISALGKIGVLLGNGVSIGAFSRIIVSTSLNNIGKFIKIGNNVGIGEYAYLGGAGGLEIGDDCIIGQYFSCHPENHNFTDETKLIRHQGTNRRGIKIGRNCWIGAKVTILDGVTVGENCVIAAGSVINKDMPANSVVGGVPAKVIKSRLLTNTSSAA